MKKITETSRLLIREFNLGDTAFIIKLLNSPGWLRFIGDRGVHTEADAQNYLQNGPMKSYESNGFGLWHISLKAEGTPIGMCGLIKRDTLEDPDIGFAMLPEFAEKGYAFEMATAVLQLSKSAFNMPRVVAITDFENLRSIALLQKIGLQFEKTVPAPNSTERLLFFGTSNTQSSADKQAIDALMTDFFSAFCNTEGQTPDLEKVQDLFIPQGIVVKNLSSVTEIFNLETFISSRKKLFESGSLLNFSEKEISGRTELFGNIAQRFSIYKKSGILNDQAFETVGMKTIQLVRMPGGWKISALAWDDALNV